jgi:DNA (cytosine-5)-methyltransferase 1
VKKLVIPASSIDVKRLTSEGWPEAEIIQSPLDNKDCKEPTVLVRRTVPDIVSGDGSTDLFYLPGQPAISLFTGAGGMDIGVESAGFCTVVQHEFDRDACSTLIVNRPEYFRNSALIQGDIWQTPTSMLLQEAGLRVGEAALVCGGPPCQGFTTANSHSHKGTYDPRNDLVMEFLRVVRQAQPRFFIMENVMGFLTFPGKIDGLGYPETFCRAAYDCYYELVYGLVDACSYGVPQTRTRFICMGTRRDLCECEGIIAGLPAPTNFSHHDLNIISTPDLLGQTEDATLIQMAPGVRYFPDRPFLKPPKPNNGSSLDDGASASHKEFYRRLLRDEPDRIVLPMERAA